MATVYCLGFADGEFGRRTVSIPTILKNANLKEGWCGRRSCRFKACSDRTKVHAIIHIWPNSKIVDKFPTMDGFSVTHFHNKIPRIYFNLDNINHLPEGFVGSKADYLAYVVQHELGHAIFKIMVHDSKDDKDAVTNTCSVMYQQTRGTGGTKGCLTGISYLPKN